MRALTFLTALPLACLFAGAAAAQDAACTKPLSVVNEIQMESGGPGPSLVPVEINGAKLNLTLATAGTTTQITEEAAKTLNLAITRGDTVLYDDTGTAYRNQVKVAKLGIGALQGSDVAIPVSPRGRGNGLFSLNHMLPYDVDVDFGTDKLRFFSQDHCPGGVLYWQARVVGVVPITVDNGRVTIPVELDGKPLTGVIDTAASDTSIKAAVAEKVMGLEASLAGKSQSFTSLRLGTLGLRNVTVAIAADGATQGGGAAVEARNRFRAIQASLATPEVKIGMDVLRKLHLYMAFGEKKLYVTPASASPATQDQAAAK